MQGHLHHHHHHHHLQQQLAALLSAALPQPSASAGESGESAPSSSQAAPEGPGERGGDAARVAALESLQRIILYPPNALVISHSSHFLSQGFCQLLSDKSFAVRRAAAIAYGSLCAILVTSPIGSNGAQSHILALIDRYMAWALPLLGDIGVANGSVELALDSLREFLNAGDANNIERFVPLILKACQELLEDERTSLSLLHQLLSVLSFVSLKFGHCFQQHFADIIDLLLGWAFMPDLSESGRAIIMDSFLQFQKHWLGNLKFSLGLLSKFLGDIEVLIQDTYIETGSQFDRLLALFSCFSTVLRVTASGMMELNTIEEAKETLENMATRLLRCIASFGRKFELSKLMGESWRCLILLAEILEERFSNSYTIVIDIFFQSLIKIASPQVHALVNTNLQMLSRQKLSLLPSSVRTLLGFYSPLSQLRLHPNNLIAASSAATYLFFLQHASDHVVSEAITSLTEELELLIVMLGDVHGFDQLTSDLGSSKGYAEQELISLIKFDINALLSSVSCGAFDCLSDQVVADTYRYERSVRLASLILGKLNPFPSSIKVCCELQVLTVKTLNKLSEVEFLSKLAILEAALEEDSSNSVGKHQRNLQTKNDLIIEYKKKYTACIVRALGPDLPISVKLEALDWIYSFCQMVTAMDRDAYVMSLCDPNEDAGFGSDLLVAVSDAAYGRESKVRCRAASVLEALLEARLIDPTYLHFVSEDVLEKFMTSTVMNYDLSWKNALALKQSPRELHTHQFVSIMSYISQRWKMSLSS